MFIIDRVKENWLLILKVLIGILAIVIFIFYFKVIFVILVAILAFFAAVFILLLVIGSLSKSYKTGFMGFFILIACMIYNPNLESFNLFINKEMNIKNNHVDNVKIINHSDWVIFSIYTVEASLSKSYMDDNNQTKVKEISLPTQYYVGALKNFWNTDRDINIDTWVYGVADIVEHGVSKFRADMQQAEVDALLKKNMIKEDTIFKGLMNRF